MILDLDPVGVIGSDLVQSHDMHGDAQFSYAPQPAGLRTRAKCFPREGAIIHTASRA